jgi:ATP-dependent DNA ligase
VRLVPVFVVADEKEEAAVYESFLKQGYEGAMIRNLDAPYEWGVDREKKSYQLRKHKPRHSAEYEVVGYTEGDSGKDMGAIIWVLQTAGGTRFNSAPVGMTYAERYAQYKEFGAVPGTFERDWKGKMMIVEYDDISDAGVPLRAKAKCLRTVP